MGSVFNLRVCPLLLPVQTTDSATEQVCFKLQTRVAPCVCNCTWVTTVSIQLSEVKAYTCHTLLFSQSTHVSSCKHQTFLQLLMSTLIQTHLSCVPRLLCPFKLNQSCLQKHVHEEEEGFHTACVCSPRPWITLMSCLSRPTPTRITS